MQLGYFFYYAESNIICVIILGILLIHNRKHSTRQEKQIWYDRTIIAHILYFLTDIGWAAVIGGELPRTRLIVILLNFLNYLFLGLMAYSWFIYMASSVRLPFMKDRRKQLLCLFPLLVSVLIIVVAFAANPYAWVTEDAELNPWYYPMMVAAPAFYLISAFVFSMIRARKAEFKEDAQLFRLIGIYPLAILGFGLFQTYVLSGAPLFCFGCAIMMLYFYIQNVQALVSVDALTRLNNRGQINRYMSRARYQDHITSYAVMMDVNNFKHINDTYGHAEGDRALILVSEVLKQALGKTKSAVFLGRYGGDEFTLFLQCGEGDVLPDQFIESVRSALKERQQKEQLPYELSISVGYDSLRDRNDTLAATLVRADNKLYEYKRAAKIGR